jgi:DNA primase
MFFFVLVLRVYCDSWSLRLSPTEFVVQKLSLSSIVSRVTPVDKFSGMCLCPFHGEKSPSMKVNEIPGYFYCFGCGESGNVIKFLSKYQKWSYSDTANQCIRLINKEITIEE